MNNSRVALFLVLALAPRLAAAQTTPADHATADQTTPGQASQGPMIFEPIHSGWLFAPDARITEVDGRTSELVGGYGGRITDDTFFIGGGGYWMANQNRDRDLAYGGLVLQWLARTSAPLGFSVKGLIGGGAATLSRTITPLPRRPGIDDNRRDTIAGRSVQVRTHQGFFVAEPEADVLVRLTRHMRLTVGAGYRFVAAERGGDDRLRGAVGTLGLQIGGGS